MNDYRNFDPEFTAEPVLDSPSENNAIIPNVLQCSFEGFNYFGNLVLASLIMGIFIAIGTFLFIIPGIYLAVAYSFTILIILFLEFEFWDAMEASRKIITKNWFMVFALILVLAILNAVGALLFFVGLLFTIPFTYCVIYFAFKDRL